MALSDEDLATITNTINNVVPDAVAQSWLSGWVPIAVAAVAWALSIYFARRIAFAAEKKEFGARLEQLKKDTEEIGKINNALTAQLAKVQNYLDTQSAVNSELRTALRELIVAICRSLHAMTYITWWGSRRGILKRNQIEDYHNLEYENLGSILGQTSVVAATNRTIYTQMWPHVHLLFALDARVTDALNTSEEEDIRRRAQEDQPPSDDSEIAVRTERFEPLYEELRQTERRLPVELENIISRIVQDPAHEVPGTEPDAA